MALAVNAMIGVFRFGPSPDRRRRVAPSPWPYLRPRRRTRAPAPTAAAPPASSGQASSNGKPPARGAGAVETGLAAGEDDAQAARTFDLLVQVAAALGGSAGATRVATDAGWTGYERQIGTTGVAIDPDLYVAFGVSGASQHTGGLGAPRHIVSVNIDGSCPMTAMADLGLVTDARELLTELAVRFGIEVPADAGPDRTVDEPEANELKVGHA